MKVLKVIGVRNMSFADRNDSEKKVSGVKVYCSRPVEDGQGEFYYPDDAFFLSDWMIINRLHSIVPRVGDMIDIRYNRQGKIESVEILDPVS